MSDKASYTEAHPLKMYHDFTATIYFAGSYDSYGSFCKGVSYNICIVYGELYYSCF